MMTSTAASHPAKRIEDNPTTRTARPATYRTTAVRTSDSVTLGGRRPMTRQGVSSSLLLSDGPLEMHSIRAPRNTLHQPHALGLRLTALACLQECAGGVGAQTSCGGKRKAIF